MCSEAGDGFPFTDTGDTQTYDFTSAAASHTFAFSYSGDGAATLLRASGAAGMMVIVQ